MGLATHAAGASLCLALLLVSALGEVAFNEPFQVVRPTANHTSMLPVPEGLVRLAHHDGNIAVVAVVGPYHSGKSFLLNALVGNTQVFSIGRKTSPETMGVWLCRTSMKASDGSEVWLMDSEGFFGPGVAETYDAKIFTIATLLGSHLVYNTVKVIDQQAVNLLEMLARRAQLFRTRSSADAASVDTPEFLSVRSFPPLTWVVEDFVQELPEEHRNHDGATGWLMSYLSKVNDTHGSRGEDVHILFRLYSDLKVHTLFLPATKKEDLQDLSRLKWDQLTPEFQQEVEILREHILQTLAARKFDGSAMTGRTLERSLRFIVQGLQRGMFHELPSLWATWTTQVAEMSLQDAETWFASLIAGIDNGEDPIPVNQFNSQVEDARSRAVKFYKELLRDFEVNPDIKELQRRMDAHFLHKTALYHERIQRWVGDVMAKAKESITKFLAAQELPMDPDLLRKHGEAKSKEAVQALSSLLQTFSARGPTPKYGRAVQMPAFSHDPVGQLSSDLHALQGARELENEREILQYFKTAVAAADEAVDREIKLNNNRLLGKMRLQELQKLVAVRCWQAFDERLSRHKWMMLLTHYKTHKALVQTETYESRMSRFAAANDQRLSAHFRTALDRCLSSYKVRKANLAMPVSEADIDSEHRQLAASIREMLDEQGRDLTDTEAYKGAVRSLNSVLEEGHLHVRQKNVELWKVHSDEATRCAMRENQAAERRCGLLCLFNKVPPVHKATSQRHLFACFARSGSGARMSPSMQMHVFEDWYSKDLAHDAANVWNNFILGIGTPLLGLIVLLLCTACAQQARPVRTGYTFGH